MTKDEHINFWITNSEADWQRCIRCYDDKDYVFSLFCLHLCLEKICKAIWIKNNESNIPPKIHDLVKIISLSNVEVTFEDLSFLEGMNRFQIEGRYPDYRKSIHRISTKYFTNELIENSKSIIKCLKEKLQ